MDIIEEINSRQWYHSFEVLPGVITPGKSWTDAAKAFDETYRVPKDLAGKRALDIGTCDGPYAFELERRGAEVTGIDMRSPDSSCFNLAKRARKSAATYIQGNVYDLDKLVTGQFDVVTFFGVWYHLRNPLLAFERIGNLTRPGGLLLFEGQVLLSSAPNVPDEEMKRLAMSSTPVALFNRDTGDRRTAMLPAAWTVPNKACVRDWLHCAGFDVLSEGDWRHGHAERMYGTAIRTDRPIPTEHPVYD